MTPLLTAKNGNTSPSSPNVQDSMLDSAQTGEKNIESAQIEFHLGIHNFRSSVLVSIQ